MVQYLNASDIKNRSLFKLCFGELKSHSVRFKLSKHFKIIFSGAFFYFCL